MMNSFMSGIKNVMLWSYARGSWQYDVLCLIIILSIFLVPSRYFGDRDRPAEANSGRVSASNSVGSAGIGAHSLRLDAADLEEFLTSINRGDLMNDPQAAIALYLHSRVSEKATLVAYQTYTDSHGRTGYRVRYR